MAFSIRTTLRNLILFVFPRYPFINAVTLLLLLAERARRETYPPLEPKVLYVHLGTFVVLGACMGFNLKRKEAATIHAGQLIYLASSIYMNQKLHYPYWVKFRMSLRGVGVAGFMLMYAFYSMPKPRSQPLRRLAEMVIGIYLLASLYSLFESPEDKEAFLSLVPGGKISLFIYGMLLGAAALCFIPGLFVYDMTQPLLVLMCVTTFFVDCNLQYWTVRRGLDFWNHTRMVCDNLAIILGIGMILTCSKKVLPLSEETLRKHDEREGIHQHID